MEFYTVNHCLPLFFILLAVEANETSYNVTESAREPRGSRRLVKQYSGTRPEPILCTDEGFRSDPTNCAVFYRCMKSGRGRYTAFKFQCAPGTLYDPDNEVCNHPHSVKRMGCGIDIASTSQQPIENEIDEQRQELPSPISTKKPVYTEYPTFSTAYPWLTSSKRQNHVPTTRGSSTTIQNLSTSSKLPLAEAVTVVTTNPLSTSTRIHRSTTPRKPSPSSQNGDPCTSEGFIGDSENCRKFYRCVDNQRGGYIRYEFLCSETTIWDEDIRSCNHAWAVKRRRCGRGSLNENNEFALQKYQGSSESSVNKNVISNVNEVQQQYSYSPPVTQTQSQISNSTVSQNQSQINYSDRKNKTKPASNLNQTQIQISHGVAVSQMQTQINYSNKVLQTQLQIDHSKESSQSQTQVHETNMNLSATTVKENSDKNDNDMTAKPSNWTVTNECLESGFMGNRNDCKKFYRCVDNGKGSYTQFEFSCGEGTVWDSKLEACNHAWAVKECGGKNPSQSTTIITEIKTTTKPSITTAATHYFVPTTQTMAIDENDDVGYGNQNQFPSTTTSTSTTTVKATSFTSMTVSTTQHIKPGNLCTSYGFMGDENDCKKFYRCVDSGNGAYTRYEFSCGEGTVWDPKIEACNHAWAVEKCGGGFSNDIHKIETTTNKVSNTMSTPTTTISTPQMTSLIPTENDDLDTGYGIQHDEFSSSSAGTSTTLIHTSSRKPAETTNNHCISSGFMGDSNDCKKFYRCVDNGNGVFTRYEFTCGEGTVWDPKIDACNHAWAVEKCGGFSTDIYKEEITTSQPTTTTTSPQIAPVISHEDNDIDTGYGQQIQSSSSSSTTIAAQQENPGLGSNECKISGFMGDSNDCNKFYRCVDNGNGSYIRYEFACGEGTVWDSKIEACNHRWAVENCGGSSFNDINKGEMTTSHVFTTSSSTQTISHLDNDYDSGYGTQYESTSSTHTNETLDYQSIECKSIGFFGDSNDCKKFYRCVDNGNGGYTRYEFSCGEGTVWDPEIESCNHGWAVEKCSHSYNITSPNQQTSVSSTATIMSDEEINSGYPQSTDKEPNKLTDTSLNASSTSKPEKRICMKEGFVGDELNCKVFYRCVDDQKGGFIMYEFSCGEGTVWDSEINSCNYIQSVKRPCSAGVVTEKPQPISEQTITQSSETQSYIESQPISSTKKPKSSSCTKEGFIRDENDCKKFYRCVDNGHGEYTKYEFTCGDGTVWNQEIQTCDHDTPDHSCSKSGTVNKEPDHKDPEHDEMYSDNSTEKPVGSNNYTSQSSETTQSSLKPSNQCRADGFYGDPGDCKKFYRCVDNGKGSFTKYDFTCGDGTVWDQDIQACNHESENKCSTNMNAESTEGSFGSTSSPTSTYTEQQQTNEVEDSLTSPTSGEDRCTSEGFFADSKDCKKFYRCVSNGKERYIKYEFTCAEGTMWVQEIQACDYEDDNLNCTKKSPTAQPPQPNEQQSTADNQSETSSIIVSEAPDKQNDEYFDSNSDKLSESCASEGFYPNSKDCKKFYRCVDNGKGGYTKYDFTCGEGTAWDTVIQNCNHISEVKSCSNQESDNKPIQDEEVSQTTVSSSTSESVQNSKPPSKETCEQEGYYGNTQDCKKFYRCVDNGKGGYTKYDYDCGEGTIWDQDITTCNHPQDVTNPTCKNSDSSTSAPSSSSTTNSPSESESQSSTSSAASSSESSTNCSQEESNKKPDEQKITCEKAGYYPNPNDCKKFYRCVDWDGDGQRFSVYHFDCGEGTIWDPQLDTCNHEESVYPPRDCSNVQSQNENNIEDTSTTETSSTTKEDSTESNSQQSTTVEQSTTTEKITTESTTTEGTTTRQPTSTEGTTSESTTESMTTQQITTTESTTSESTTAQGMTTASTTKSTTTESTTTQGTTTTTTENTTTESSTTEGSTTQQSTTEGLTTERSTTTEESTNQENITEESTTTTTEQTTQHSDNSDQTTTTEQSTTSQPTTTQQSTTSEQTTASEQTTQKSTTEESTTTTEQSGTEESESTDGSTTQQSNTTDQSSTEQTTTEKSDSQTTHESTITTTQQSGNESTTTTTEQSGNESTTEDNETTTEDGQDSTTEVSSSSKECPDTENDQYLYVCPTSFRRHPKYCNMFYQCTEDNDSHELKIAVFTCPNNTIYDESKTQCVEEDKADKECDGEIAQRRRDKRLNKNNKEPILVGKQRLSCPAIGYFSFEKDTECSPAFIKCQKAESGRLRGFVHKCPEGYLYWSISKRCEKKENVMDCKRSSNDWSRRWEIPVERKNVASSM